MSPKSWNIRLAEPRDVATIVDFNQRLARETESLTLDPQRLTEGVSAVINDRHKGIYYVAEDAGTVVGQLLLTNEWSDWRNGKILWLQSVYVAAPYRGQGVLRALVQHVQEVAAGDPSIVGLRLYVEHNNKPAYDVYHRLGFRPGGYEVLQQFWRGGLEA